jgi:hypothetical protein
MIRVVNGLAQVFLEAIWACYRLMSMLVG